MKLRSIIINIDDLLAASVSAVTMEDKGWFLSGLLTGMSGGQGVQSWGANYMNGYEAGVAYRQATINSRQQRSEAGSRSAKARAEKHGTAQPAKQVSFDARSESRSESVREVVRRTPVSAAPPTVEEVEAYRLEIGGTLPAQEFIDANSSRGWVQGKAKAKIVDWKAHYRAWNRRHTPRPTLPESDLLDRCSPFMTYWRNADGMREAKDGLAAASLLYTEDEILSALKWHLKEHRAKAEVSSLLAVVRSHHAHLSQPEAPKEAAGYASLMAVINQHGKAKVEEVTGCGELTDERLSKARIYGSAWIDEVLATWGERFGK